MSSKVYRAQAYQSLWVVQAAAGSGLIEPSLVRLLVDTGSSYTVLPSRVLKAMGLDLAQSSRVSIVAAGGVIQVPVVRIPWLSCLGQRVEDFPVVGLDLPRNAFTSGLLGMDFMKRFGVVIDTASGELRLGSKGQT
jgi:predicted aspartyl protease